MYTHNRLYSFYADMNCGKKRGVRLFASHTHSHLCEYKKLQVEVVGDEFLLSSTEHVHVWSCECDRALRSEGCKSDAERTSIMCRDRSKVEESQHGFSWSCIWVQKDLEAKQPESVSRLQLAEGWLVLSLCLEWRGNYSHSLGWTKWLGDPDKWGAFVKNLAKDPPSKNFYFTKRVEWLPNIPFDSRSLLVFWQIFAVSQQVEFLAKRQKRLEATLTTTVGATTRESCPAVFFPSNRVKGYDSLVPDLSCAETTEGLCKFVWDKL